MRPELQGGLQGGRLQHPGGGAGQGEHDQSLQDHEQQQQGDQGVLLGHGGSQARCGKEKIQRKGSKAHYSCVTEGVKKEKLCILSPGTLSVTLSN